MKPKPISEIMKCQVSFDGQDLLNERTFSFTPLKASSSVCLAHSAQNEKKFHSSLLESVPLSSGARPGGNRMGAALELQL